MKKFSVVLAVLVIILTALVAKAIYKKTHIEEPTVYIVYTDDDGDLYADEYVEPTTYKVAYTPLTEDDTERIARLLSGLAKDRTEACMRMVASVLYNDISECDGDIDRAVKEFHLGKGSEPTEKVYEVVEAVFFKGDFMLDDDVMWCNNTNTKSGFHESLVYVCECDGIAFYKAHRANIEEV